MSKVPKQSSDFRRSETGQKLEEILNANSSQKLETSQLRQALAEVALDQKLAVESLGFLNEIFSPSDPLPRRLNQNRILKDQQWNLYLLLSTIIIFQLFDSQD